MPSARFFGSFFLLSRVFAVQVCKWNLLVYLRLPLMGFTTQLNVYATEGVTSWST